MKHCPEPSVRERMGKFARRHPGLCGSTSIAVLAVMAIGLLGGALTLVYDKMQELSARVQYRIFDRNFTESQFLLNTAGGSNEHLKKGIAKAVQTMKALGATTIAPALGANGSAGWLTRRLGGPRADRRADHARSTHQVLLASKAG